MAKASAVAAKLHELAEDLHDAADAYEREIRDVLAADRRIAEVERIVSDARAAVRGPAR